MNSCLFNQTPPETAVVSSRFYNEIAVDRSLRGCRSGSHYVFTRAATISMIATNRQKNERQNRRSWLIRWCIGLFVSVLLAGSAAPSITAHLLTSGKRFLQEFPERLTVRV